MVADLIKGAISPIVTGILKLIPDKNARAEAQELLEVKLISVLASLMQAQMQINMKEAEHGSIFVAGWRPAIGWICGIALGWNYILQPLVSWAAFIGGVDLGEAPRLDTAELTTILLGMLGLGGLRTYEKRLGVARIGIQNGGSE